MPAPPTAHLSDVKLHYFAKLDGASQPFKTQRDDGRQAGAKPAFSTCLDYSVKYQFFDEYSRKCEVWLSKNYGAEYHLIDEFRGAPTRSNSGLNGLAAAAPHRRHGLADPERPRGREADRTGRSRGRQGNKRRPAKK